jgi:hypothetical protein
MASDHKEIASDKTAYDHRAGGDGNVAVDAARNLGVTSYG